MVCPSLIAQSQPLRGARCPAQPWTLVDFPHLVYRLSARCPVAVALGGCPPTPNALVVGLQSVQDVTTSQLFSAATSLYTSSETRALPVARPLRATISNLSSYRTSGRRRSPVASPLEQLRPTRLFCLQPKDPKRGTITQSSTRCIGNASGIPGHALAETWEGRNAIRQSLPGMCLFSIAWPSDHTFPVGDDDGGGGVGFRLPFHDKWLSYLFVQLGRHSCTTGTCCVFLHATSLLPV